MTFTATDVKQNTKRAKSSQQGIFIFFAGISVRFVIRNFWLFGPFFKQILCDLRVPLREAIFQRLIASALSVQFVK